MISVLRIGHRLGRDERVSTHVGLVARAFGAKEIIYSGERDEGLVTSLKLVTKKWGGPFKVRYEQKWRNVIKSYKKKRYSVVHLTMYGIPIERIVRKLRKCRDILVVVGSEKVPGEVFGLADYNIAITNQPHSEVAALAVFLRECSKGKYGKFTKAKIRIVPQEKGKSVIEL